MTTTQLSLKQRISFAITFFILFRFSTSSEMCIFALFLLVFCLFLMNMQKASPTKVFTSHRYYLLVLLMSLYYFLLKEMVLFGDQKMFVILPLDFFCAAFLLFMIHFVFFKFLFKNSLAFNFKLKPLSCLSVFLLILISRFTVSGIANAIEELRGSQGLFSDFFGSGSSRSSAISSLNTSFSLYLAIAYFLFLCVINAKTFKLPDDIPSQEEEQNPNANNSAPSEETNDSPLPLSSEPKINEGD